MRTGWILRGQSSGLMHSRVFTSYPTDDDFREAMRFELERHGLVVKAVPVEVADGEEPRAVLTFTAKDRWVRVTEVQIVGLDPAPAPSEEEKAARREEMVGRLSDEDVARIGESYAAAPPGTASGVSMAPTMTGEGTVTNPGDPGYVKAETKYPEVITSADVGSVSAVLAK